MRLCAHFAAKHPRTIRNQAHLPPYHPFISINTSRYGTLTADPAGLMNKYSNQFIAALQGKQSCIKYGVQKHYPASSPTVMGVCPITFKRRGG